MINDQDHQEEHNVDGRNVKQFLKKLAEELKMISGDDIERRNKKLSCVEKFN